MKGYVYLIRPVGKNVYKIGSTNNLERRLKRYNNKKQSVIYEFVDYFFSNDCVALEERLHSYYSKYILSGEWFALPDNEIFNFQSIAMQLQQWVDSRNRRYKS